jgi:hypothetical protein
LSEVCGKVAQNGPSLDCVFTGSLAHWFTRMLAQLRLVFVVVPSFLVSLAMGLSLHPSASRLFLFNKSKHGELIGIPLLVQQIQAWRVNWYHNAARFWRNSELTGIGMLQGFDGIQSSLVSECCKVLTEFRVHWFRNAARFWRNSELTGIGMLQGFDGNQN